MARALWLTPARLVSSVALIRCSSPLRGLGSTPDHARRAPRIVDLPEGRHRGIRVAHAAPRAQPDRRGVCRAARSLDQRPRALSERPRQLQTR